MPTPSLVTTSFESIVITNPDPGIYVATLNRPDKLNALDPALWDDLDLLSEVLERQDPDVRVLVLTGAGRGFCAGMDLGTMSAETTVEVATVPGMMTLQQRYARSIARFKQVPVPVVAAVNGPAAGGGLALALAADVRIAAPEARFTVAFIRIGLSGCDVGVSWLLPRVVGLGHASEMMLTGRLVAAHEAERIGLVNRVVPAQELLPAAYDVAREIGRNSPFALKLTKEGLQVNVDAPSIEAAIALENRNQALTSRSEDRAAALSAFLTKTDPVFTGR